MGSSPAESRKPHAHARAVCIPFPAQGHVNPMMQLAKLLHARSVFLTFVNTAFNHRRHLQAKGPDSLRDLENFCFETIPNGLPPSDRDSTQDVPALCGSNRKNCLGPFKKLLARIKNNEVVPPLSCVISVGVMSFASEAARELGVPEVQFWTASGCGFIGYLQYTELAKRGIVPFKDEDFLNNGMLDDPVDWILGIRNIRLRDVASFRRTTDLKDVMFDFLGEEAQHCLKSSAILFNTINELEHEVLEKIADLSPRIYCTGPLSFLIQDIPSSSVKSFRLSLWKEGYSCLEWLDQREAESIVYVNYGSVTVMTEEHLKEFACGLANGKHPILWVIRPDVVKGDSAIPPPPLKHKSGKSLLQESKRIIPYALGSVLLTGILCLILVKHYLKQNSSRRRRDAPILVHTQQEFLDEDHGLPLDHPIWFIRTIGLDQSIINSVMAFEHKKGKGLIDGTECSVCLSEFEDGENLRLLPKCSHAFHVPCIDTWLRSEESSTLSCGDSQRG